MLEKFVKKYLINKNLKKIKATCTFIGKNLEITHKTSVRLVDGSNKNDIIIHDKVALISCSITSSNNGKIEIGEYCKFGPGCSIMAANSIKVGAYTAVAINVTITDNNNHPINPEYRRYMRTTPHGSDARSIRHSDNAPIVIGENCWIGQNVRIQKGVTIGNNSIIAANSIVTKSIPENSIAAGNPARVVKTDIDQIPAPDTCKDFNAWRESNTPVK